MIEYLPLVLTGLGLTASILYYASVLRNANKTQQQQLETREIQIFMQLMQQISNEASYKTWAEIVNQGKVDYDEYVEKFDSSVNPEHYAKRCTLWHNYNSIGELLRQGVIDHDLLERMLVAPMILIMWENWEHIIKKTRERENAPEIWLGFEYLYNEISCKRRQKGYPDYTYPL